ncbi:polymer-forming cytoskeletal protein [Longimicrobium sp.]|uniref:bactofilin family protein n=1 Tax=Longimicrobium sp. TaxID=2029185 RepID=UPI002E346EFF|nr:polymer-forming cytoskeletal protein [Longimicrobium sp.]HEX6042181.1 polymer-forming cytoskeletal protein [Longimicrobium sp.]
MLGGGKKVERGNDRGTMLGRAVGGGEASMSIIGPGMNIVGDLVTDGTVRVEGRIEGTVRAGKAVVIGKGGEIVGDVLTQDAVIGGRVQGTIVAESRLEAQATSIIEGHIRVRSGHLLVEEGAVHNGQTQMLDGTESLALPAPPRVENSTES